MVCVSLDSSSLDDARLVNYLNLLKQGLPKTSRFNDLQLDYSLYKRESTKQFHYSKIKLPLVFKKVQPPTRKLKTTYKASRPNLFVLVKSLFEIFDVSFSVCKDSSVDTMIRISWLLIALFLNSISERLNWEKNVNLYC
ncbi:60S ribosomal protein L18a-2 [Artemisia annua]|uniref:60S ribosomal protein L18a-2 n=1 Tax=Artemisia annua TaxID=35608 RepID=A0A2U1KJR3_ARTAN|nr:60S ribosomal protein L18a-2 [Artemisia annua]